MVGAGVRGLPPASSRQRIVHGIRHYTIRDVSAMTKKTVDVEEAQGT
jgi:hypothetical protein